MARPTTYKSDLLPIIIDLMKNGASIEEVCLELDICRQTFYNWCDKYPELLDTKKRGEDFSKGWWMKEGRVNLRNKDFVYPLWYMNMKNRFGWRDTHDVNSNVKGEVNINPKKWVE